MLTFCNCLNINKMYHSMTGDIFIQRKHSNRLHCIFANIVLCVCPQMTLKTAANLIQFNNLTDNGPIKGMDNSNQTPPRFDKHLEEFYSICDQIELHLKTSISCLQQHSASQRYLPSTVHPTRIEPFPATETTLAYPQYLSTVRQQIAFAKDIHDTLVCAAQNIAPSDNWRRAKKCDGIVRKSWLPTSH